jgi:hypothetical protein
MSKRKKWLVQFNLETGKTVIKEYQGEVILLPGNWIYDVFECVKPTKNKMVKYYLDTLKEQREFLIREYILEK